MERRMDPISVSSAVSYLEPTFKRILKIWWSWLWRVCLWVFLTSFVYGFVLGFAGIWKSLSEAERFRGSFWAACVAGLVIQPLVLRKILKKDFGEFRVVLLGKQP
jgi:ABC-type Fe3+ transport system permease subunit